MKQYNTLNDALPPGDTQIWYMCPEYFRTFIFGPDKVPASLLPRSPLSLVKTHILLGSIAETDLETIFKLMQGESWSRNGEARNLILGKGLAHTSMSVGDCVVINNEIHMCDVFGWRLMK